MGGRPKVSPVLKLFSFLYPKDTFDINIFMNGEHVEKYNPPSVPTADYVKNTQPSTPEKSEPVQSGKCTYRLEELAYTRSGDKGNTCNIGVIARHPALLPYLKAALTQENVENYFAHVFPSRDGVIERRIQRYEVPGINGLNFMLYNALGGGGIASLRSDPQGKAFGQMLLDFEIKNVPNLDRFLEKSK